MSVRSHSRELRDAGRAESRSEIAVAVEADGYAQTGDAVVFRGCFAQIHIDAARFSTNDFNPFHDPGKWCRIAGNPFAGPLVLGFQCEALIERADLVDALRLSTLPQFGKIFSGNRLKLP